MATKVHHPSSYGVWHMGTGILRPYQAFPVVCIYRIMIQRFNICYIETTAMVHHLPIHSYGILMNHLFGHQLIMVHQQHQGGTTAAPATRVSLEEPTACTPEVARVANIITHTLWGIDQTLSQQHHHTVDSGSHFGAPNRAMGRPSTHLLGPPHNPSVSGAGDGPAIPPEVGGG